MAVPTETATAEEEEDMVVEEMGMEGGEITTKAVVGGVEGTRATMRTVTVRRGMIAVEDAEGEGTMAVVEDTVGVMEEVGMMDDGRRAVAECC